MCTCATACVQCFLYLLLLFVCLLFDRCHYLSVFGLELYVDHAALMLTELACLCLPGLRPCPPHLLRRCSSHGLQERPWRTRPRLVINCPVVSSLFTSYPPSLGDFIARCKIAFLTVVQGPVVTPSCFACAQICTCVRCHRCTETGGKKNPLNSCLFFTGSRM